MSLLRVGARHALPYETHGVQVSANAQIQIQREDLCDNLQARRYERSDKMTNKQRNYVRAKAITEKNKERIVAICPSADERSGIYVFRRNENGFKYAYIGQARHLLARIAEHLSGYQHIDLSIKKHGLYDFLNNPIGWSVSVAYYSIEQLDDMEQEYIRQYAAMGYQLYNHTTGGQGDGKRTLGETKSTKGYREGVAQGERNAIKKIGHLFDLHLKAVTKANTPNKTQEKALKKFYDLIGGEK